MGRIVHYNHYLEEEEEDLKRDMDDHSVENHRTSVDEEESVQESYMRRRKHKRQLIQKTIKFICEKTNQEQLDTKVWHYGSTSMNHPAYVNDIVPTKPYTLKRDGPSSSSNDNDDQSRVEETNNGGSRRKKKMRLNDSRSHPWDHSTLQTSSNNNSNNKKKQPASTISVQIQFTSNSKHDLLKQQTNKNPAVIAAEANDDESEADHNDSKDDKENNQSSSQKDNSNKFQTTFDLEQDVPLHHIFQQVATAHDLDRQCLQFTYRGQILEGDETPLSMSKYYGSASSKDNDDDNDDGGDHTNHHNLANGGQPSLDQHQSAAAALVLLKIDCSPVLSEC